MATLPPIKRITKEDLKDAPAWIDRLLYPLNLFLDFTYRAMNGNLTFVDNITAQKYGFTITAGAAATDNTLKFTPTINKRPEFILCTATEKNTNYAPIAQAVYVEWFYDGSFIQISSITGLTNGKIYDFLILII